MNNAAKSAEAVSEEEILRELKEAYNSINALKKSPSHKKIADALERKMRRAAAKK
ncbi:MAG: hypothetical protein IJI37_02805 [Opitutales bacterium]|nr:hypothetical protein [Opitutales bacterium]